LQSFTTPTSLFAREHAEPDALRVLIAGGGVAGLEVMLALRKLAGERVNLTLLGPAEHFVYRPLEVLAPFQPQAVVRIPWAEIADDLGVNHVRDALTSVDADTRLVRTAGGLLADYDALVIAAGARRRVAVPGALTLGMPGTDAKLNAIIAGVTKGGPARIAFVAPLGVAWTLPIYELALLTAARAGASGAGVKLAVVTAEPEPLKVLGPGAGTLVRKLLAENDIGLHTGSVAGSYEHGYLKLELEGAVAVAGAVVALPRLEGPHIPGLRATAEGFLPIDGDGRVQGEDDIYAVGDVTSFPIKQGGLATQQADAAAAHIALRAGVAVDRDAFDPVLRALMLTGGASRFLRRGGITEPDRTEISDEPPWWPPAKIVGRHLSPYLAARSEEALASGSRLAP
jgi:sulfide:quinone oxidoreductase